MTDGLPVRIDRVDATTRCPACAHEARRDARFCEACGTPLTVRRCAGCGEDLRAGMGFCDGCGRPVEPAAEVRKTITAVFCDLAGSTALQERLDPETVRRVMGRYYATMRDTIESHGGSVEKFIGDAVVARWGVAIVSEDDAVRAVRAADAMRAGVDGLNEELETAWGVRLKTRIGVNTGEVVGAVDGLLVGDPVNTAARLEQAAPIGEVLLGEPTWRLVRYQVTVEEVAPIVAAGKAAPVRAFRLLDARTPAPDVSSPLAPYVGRDAELASLQEAYARAQEDRSCRLTTVIGSPGLGKTRLAAEFAAHVHASGGRVLTGHCDATSEGATLLPVAEVLSQAAGVQDGDSPLGLVERLRGMLPADDPDAARIAELAAGVLGIAPVAAAQETFWAVRRVLEALARERPLLVVLDDVQWGTPQFLDLIEHLVEWLRDAPVLLLALARPELRDVSEALTRPDGPGREVLDLVPLDDLKSQELVRGMLGEIDVPQAVAERMLRTAEGNPLFLSELLRMLVDDGTLQRDGDAWVLAPGAVVEVPPTVEALLAARLERLRPPERTFIEHAAVIGRQFHPGAVAYLGRTALTGEVSGHLEALHRKELVEPDGSFLINEAVFRFHHVLIRDAAYRTLLKETRAALHERFARWLEEKAGALIGEHEEVVAFHLEQAHEHRRQLGPLDARGRALGAEARARLASAGRRALAREDLAAAATLLGRADARGPEPDAELLIDLCDALVSGGSAREAADALGRLRSATAGDRRTSAVADVIAAELASLTRDEHADAARPPLEAAVIVLRAAGDHRRLAQALELTARLEGLHGRHAEAEAALDEALAAAREAGDARRVARVLSMAPLTALWGPTPVPRASGRCLDVVRILRAAGGSRHVEGRALRVQALLGAMRGNPDAAREQLRQVRAGFEELGLDLELANTDLMAARVHLLSGDPAAAETHARRAVEGFAALGVDAAMAEAVLARALLEQGRDVEALALVAAPRPETPMDLLVLAGTVRAEVLSRRGEHDAAVALARVVAGRAQASDALVERAEGLETLARVLRAAGEETGANVARSEAHAAYVAKGHEVGARRTAASAGEVVSATPDCAAVPGKEAGACCPAYGRIIAALNQRDWETLGRCMADDYELRDLRPVGWDPISGRDAIVALFQSWEKAAPGATKTYEVLAVRGPVAVIRFTARAPTPGGVAVTVQGHVNRVDDHGLTDRGWIFEADDVAGMIAHAERIADEVPAPDLAAGAPVIAADAEPGTRTPLLERLCAALNRGDVEAVGACYRETGFEAHDRRPLGREPIAGRDAAILRWRSWIQAAPTGSASHEPLAVRGSVVVGRVACSPAPGGGARTDVQGWVMQLDERGAAARVWLHEPGDVAAMIACAERLAEPTRDA